MRVWAVSDVHVDFEMNRKWIAGLSAYDFKEDILILAGDVSDAPRLLRWCFGELVRRFSHVVFVPGNHELWVIRDPTVHSSFEKFDQVCALAKECGVSTRPHRDGNLTIVPLFSWYDYSFGMPTRELLECWMDFRACKWPAGYEPSDVTAHFSSHNNVSAMALGKGTVITFSHFLPRIDLMPKFIPPKSQILYPVLGSTALEAQIRRLGAKHHVYGHSHINRRLVRDGVEYCNNALGYPHECCIAKRELLCVHAV
jgi:hypothetical protein